MINWYPHRIFPTTINNFSPRLKKVLSNPENWGLDGQYQYFGERWERNRSGSGSPYTEWVDRDETFFVRIDWENTPQKTFRQVFLDSDEIDINPEEDIVSDTLIMWLRDLSLQDGYELTNISEADLNIDAWEYTDTFTLSGGNVGSGDFQYTGNGETFGHEWTAKVDFSNWRQVKI